ncbi:hypothetical protein [Streptomyces tsukubensis]|uniref:hypothetical protein n=1 Tax=Streptomyces tsukubensis TaxID=83656 RepID=UPI001265DDAF|nr:hypothetical protein [Streptomyces tsukubensis]
MSAVDPGDDTFLVVPQGPRGAPGGFAGGGDGEAGDSVLEEFDIPGGDLDDLSLELGTNLLGACQKVIDMLVVLMDR